MRNAPLSWARGATCRYDHSDVDDVTNVREVALEDLEASLDEACGALGVSRWATEALDETAAKALAARRLAQTQRQLELRPPALRAAFGPARAHLEAHLAAAAAQAVSEPGELRAAQQAAEQARARPSVARLSAAAPATRMAGLLAQASQAQPRSGYYSDDSD
jgi:hypothetical protein